jgi:DNA topoisomerase II
MPPKVQYEKLSLHDQILLRPDTYIGSIKRIPTSEPVYTFVENNQPKSQLDGKLVKETVSFADGLLRLFIEAVSNAIDNVWRSLEEKIVPKYIYIDVDEKTGEFSVWNDGRNIPTGMHPTEKVRIPEMIFGQLLTSSNYNDLEERKTSGKNGLGGKALNIFSKSVQIQIYNKEEKVLYTQSWENNMKIRHDPILQTKGFPKTTEEGKNGYTCVKWTPDYQRFGYPNGLDKEIMGQIKKTVLDVALTVSFNKVQVLFNKQLVPIVSIQDYIKYFNVLTTVDTSSVNSVTSSKLTSPHQSDDEQSDNEGDSEAEEGELDDKKVKVSKPKDEFMLLSTDECKVYIAPADEWTHISFVNGIFTKDGGVHVDAWSEAIFRPIVNKLNSSKKKDKIDIRDVRKHFFLFVFASIDKPTFDSQSKTRLNGPAVKAELKDANLKKIMKWSFIKKIEDALKLKEMLTLKKTTERKKGSNRVEGLDDAKYAGKKPDQCYLIITEGASAKTYVVQGMKYGIQGKMGRDWIGVMPIRGKFLNTRNANPTQLGKNKEVVALIQALGLQYGLDYTLEENKKKLRYHRFVCATDSDVDGFHITGLLYNFFHSLFPTVLQIPGFFNFMRVPIVKINLGKNKEINFFYQEQARDYIEKNKVKKDNIKYYKGLGTANNEDVKKDFGRRIVQVNLDEKADKTIVHIFDKEHAEYRKKWLTNFKPRVDYPEIKDYSIENESITDFLNLELINFSIDDCKRSIPSLADGLKESYRKVLHAAFKRNLSYKGKTLKVAQFAGYVAEHTNYHHGEMNLFETITKMAQRFVGSNNIPLLFNDGQFGSRLGSSGGGVGKDAANGRYIFTKLDQFTRLIFRPEDDDYLVNLEDDGDIVEKEQYLPIIPMVLVNPTTAGIGTGWSCNIPAYNPTVLIEWIRIWLSKRSTSTPIDIEYPQLVPYYKGFKGTVVANGSTVTTFGVVAKTKNGHYRITEIPIGRKMFSIERYKEKLEDLKEKGIIKSIVSDDHTDEVVDFTVSCDKVPEHKDLELVDTLSTNNMVLFNTKGKLVKYNTVEDILEEYCTERLAFYTIRKNGEIKKMEHHISVLENKIHFISDIITNKINFQRMSDDDLGQYLITNKFSKVDDSYEYLLSIQARTMTKTKVESLKEQHEKAIKELEAYKKRKECQIYG